MSRPWLIITLLCLTYVQVRSQNRSKIDSLKVVLLTAKEDTNKVNTYLSLLKAIGKPDESVLEFATKALHLSKNLNYHSGEARALNYFAKYYQSKGDNMLAMESISSAVFEAQKTKNAKLRKHCNDMLLYTYKQGNYTKEALKVCLTTIDKMENDTNKVNLMIDYINCEDEENKLHLEYADKALALAGDINYYKGQTSAYGFMANYYFGEGEGKNNKKALWAAGKVIETSKKSRDKRSEVLGLELIAKIYVDEHQTREGTDHFLRALKISQSIKDTTTTFLLCLDLGNSYNNLAYSNNGKVNTTSRASCLDSSVFYHKQALAIINLLPEKHELLDGVTKDVLKAIVEQQLGMTYLNQNDTINGTKYIMTSAAVMTDSKSDLFKDSIGTTVAYGSLAYLYSVKKNSDSALFYLNRKMGIRVKPDDYYAGDLKGKSEIYYKKGEFKTAYDLLNRSFEINDSLMKVKSKNEIQELLVKYQTAEKEIQIVKLNKDNLIKEIELKTSRAYTTVAFSGLGLLLLFLLFMWYYYRTKRKTSILMSEKKEISALLDGQEKERERIASDLHDRLGSMLATVKLYFNSVEENFEHLKNENKAHYAKASALLDEACEEVRRISHDLASGVLVKLGLMAALHELKDTVSKTGKLQVEVFASGMNERLPVEMEVNIYRIIQELLSNALKHANAKKLILQITRNENELNLIVEDNGIGFVEGESASQDGIGLKNVRERTIKMNGLMKVDSRSGRGATFIFDIPLQNT